jgi:hypothetical protein
VRRGAAGALASAALAAAAALVAPPAAPAAPVAPPRFDPPPHPDARDAGALDLRRVAFGQRDLRMVLTVRTGGAWRTNGLRRGREMCVVVAPRRRSRAGSAGAGSAAPAGRLCVVPGRGRRALLRFAPSRGAARVVPGVVVRRDGRSLRAIFAPRAVGLRIGPVRWAVEARDGEHVDRAPDRGWYAASVRLLGQPRCFGAAARDPRAPCRNASLRRVVFPRPFDAFLWDNSPCRRLPTQPRGPFAPCEFGVTGGGHGGSFLLIGDSHAMHWRAALQVVAEAKRWRGISVARPGCPFSTRVPRTPALGPGQCARLQREALGWLRAHPEIETLFVSNWAPPGSSPIGGNAAYGGGAAQYGAMLDRVPPSVKRIYVLRDIPGTSDRSVACVRARRRRGLPLVNACGAPRSAVLVGDPGATAAAARTPRARAVDLTRFFCGRSHCFPVIGGAYVYKDHDHMNAVFAMSLGPYVLRALGDTPPMRSRHLVPLLAASLAAGLPAAPAEAASPPKGRYSCIIPRLPTPFYAGYLHILSASRYRVENERGRYRTRGRRIIFRSGPHKGQWKKATWKYEGDASRGRLAVITLEPKREGQAWQCTQEK